MYFILLNSSQEEFDDEDDWNPCKAAGVCLMLLAQCCENGILESHVIEFITANIEKEDWKSRDAAVMAFGTFKIICKESLNETSSFYD